jgi:hypothetical protein
MKKIQAFAKNVINIMITFLLMAAPIAALIYSSQPLEERGLGSVITSTYQELLDEQANLYDTELNQWYAELSGQPTTIDIVDQKLFK